MLGCSATTSALPRLENRRCISKEPAATGDRVPLTEYRIQVLCPKRSSFLALHGIL